MTDVVLPCLDEAAALPWVLARIPDGYRAIVADNGSTDGSARIAAEHGAVVVDVPQRGFGAAVHAGLLAAAHLATVRSVATVRSATTGAATDRAATDPPDDDLVCVLDADGSFDPAELPRVVEPVRAGAADLVLGRRRPTVPGAWPVHARVGNAALAWRLRRATGAPVHDLGPMRAARRTAWLGLDIRDRRFGYPLEMVVRAAHAGWRVVEVDVGYAPRAEGTRSKVTGTLLGTARTVHDMARVLAA
jgi:glycosyltransferase involved in cell wall biosynthesis